MNFENNLVGARYPSWGSFIPVDQDARAGGKLSVGIFVPRGGWQAVRGYLRPRGGGQAAQGPRYTGCERKKLIEIV